MFYFGCHILKTPDILFACMDVFERMGLNFVVKGGLANCCGINHFRTGSPEMGAALGSSSLRQIQACAPEKVITFCPTCQMQYTEYRPLYEGPSNEELPFVHVTQHLVENLEKLRALCIHPVPKRVALHLHTGGPAGIEENVKAILACVPGLEVVDIEQHADHCYQCPTLVLPGATEAMRAKLFASAEAAGVDAILTIYHSCQFELCGEEKALPLVIENFMTILGRSMGFEYPDQLKAFKLYEDVGRVIDAAEDFLNARGIRPEKVRDQLQAALYGQVSPPVLK
ncbi:MAG: (Fe-S)-binding protein [bacterium]|nr:(Fe-S)-binding protein [bacterium]